MAAKVSTPISATSAGTEWHNLSVDDVLNRLNTKPHGLGSKEANARILKHGPNEIVERRKRGGIELFIDQFKSFLIWILLFAVAVSALLGEIIDAVVIAAIILINAALGFFQTKKAEEALAALKKMTVPYVKVIRDGSVKNISARELVPGDIIQLSVGDKIPADCRIVSQMNLKVDESILTGESVPVVKEERKLKAEMSIHKRTNMLFSGTTIVYGRCTAAVVLTGMATEFGKIAETVQAPAEKTPLQMKLDAFSKQVGIIFLVICAAVFVLGISRGEPPIDIFITSLALAVAAVPEGLLAAITLALAVGVGRMAVQKTIIKRLAAVESLGSVTVICTDKTGTLTVNAMTVKKVWTASHEVDVTGEGYGTKGTFTAKGKTVDVHNEKELILAVKAGVLCNDAIIDHEVIGDPTEAALLVVGQKARLEDPRKTHKRIDEIPFDSKRKMMSTLYDIDGRTVFVKGAVEEVLHRCTTILVKGRQIRMTTADIKAISDANRRYASKAYRVIAVAMKKIGEDERISENNLTFLGLHAMFDPPRPGAKEAIAMCNSAGIRTVMITGDHRETAVAVAKELNLLGKKSEGAVLTGEELDKLNDDEFERMVENVRVYARVSPEHKVRITTMLKKKGHIVAMTGDGINDAPALRKSDVGVAMGITGTDVTKEVSDVVITDDNFATIVAAVKEGRGIYDNIRKSIAFLLSGNIAEVLIVFSAIALGLPLPLIAIQILWINLVTDGLPALALSVDPISKDVMRRKPRPANEKLTDGMRPYIIDYPLILAAAAILIFVLSLNAGKDLIRAQTIVFTTIILFEVFQSFSCRSLERPVGATIFENKHLIFTFFLSLMLHITILNIGLLNTIFGVVPLSISEWLEITAIALTGFVYLEFIKSINQRNQYPIKT